MSDQVWLAWISLVAAVVGPLALAAAGWIKAKSLSSQVEDVHTIVNHQRTEMMNEIESLKAEVKQLKSK
jgi:hypothetical protein